jgi:hypothetical protein
MSPSIPFAMASVKRCESRRGPFRATSARIVVRGQIIYGLNFADIRKFVEAIGRQFLADKKEFFLDLTGRAGADVSL